MVLINDSDIPINNKEPTGYWQFILENSTEPSLIRKKTRFTVLEVKQESLYKHVISTTTSDGSKVKIKFFSESTLGYLLEFFELEGLNIKIIK